MNDSATHAASYCSDLVRRRDEDRWLSAQYASSDSARKLRALYALQCELRHVPMAVSEAPLGEIRLQWWRDALGEIRDGKPHRQHPVVEEIAAAGLADPAFAELMETAIDAASRPLYGEGFTDIEDLAGWLKSADGAFDALAVKVSGGDDALAEAASSAGAAFALAREGRRLAPSLSESIGVHAAALWDAARAKIVAAPSETAPALAHLSLVKAYLDRDDKPFPLVKRLRLFSCIAFGRY